MFKSVDYTEDVPQPPDIFAEMSKRPPEQVLVDIMAKMNDTYVSQTNALLAEHAQEMSDLQKRNNEELKDMIRQHGESEKRLAEEHSFQMTEHYKHISTSVDAHIAQSKPVYIVANGKRVIGLYSNSRYGDEYYRNLPPTNNSSLTSTIFSYFTTK